ncbi:MAG TPA: hypothetical protein VEG39_04435 [Clostridia bacterium]|nr:hypothetical protein [Clostridia bacterium]
MSWDGIYDGKGENLGLKIRDKLEGKVQVEIRELLEMYEAVKSISKGKLEPLFR